MYCTVCMSPACVQCNTNPAPLSHGCRCFLPRSTSCLRQPLISLTLMSTSPPRGSGLRRSQTSVSVEGRGGGGGVDLHERGTLAFLSLISSYSCVLNYRLKACLINYTRFWCMFQSHNSLSSKLKTIPPPPPPGSEDDLEYYVRECGSIMGVSSRLPAEGCTGKHILEHILTQLTEFKKASQVPLLTN